MTLLLPLGVACGRVGFDLVDAKGGASADASGGDGGSEARGVAGRSGSAGGASGASGASSGSSGGAGGSTDSAINRGGTNAVDASSDDGTATGGATASGGSPSGGATASGGAGALTGSGGVASGGVTGAGGALGAGGVMGSGGAGTGGVTGSGGALGTGGAASSPNYAVASGEAHTCSIGAGLLYCWGANALSALGGAVGAVASSPQHVLGPGTTGGFIEVTAGVKYGCALHSNGGVWCWGNNAEGELGTSDVGTRATPNPVTLSEAARLISAPSGTTCAVLVDGTLWCWGLNTEGQCGQNDPMPWTNALRPLKVPSTAAWMSVGAGQGHVCGIQQPGTLWCWGRNTTGGLGLGTIVPNQIRTPTRVGAAADWTAITSGQLQSCGIRNPGTLWCWGDNSAGQLGQPDTAERDAPTQVGSADDWTSVSINAFHTCGIRKPGTLWCWGRNVEGQLGVGDYSPRTTVVQAGTRTDWLEVSTGRFHTCARRADNTIWCTGDNPSGQLGTGNTTRSASLLAVLAYPP
jgi:alpha-tubulin suppressor-like RCC1 family protein